MMQDKEKLSNNRVTVWNNNEGLKKKKNSNQRWGKTKHFSWNTGLLAMLVFLESEELIILQIQNTVYFCQLVHKTDYCIYA